MTNFASQSQNSTNMETLFVVLMTILGIASLAVVIFVYIPQDVLSVKAKLAIFSLFVITLFL